MSETEQSTTQQPVVRIHGLGELLEEIRKSYAALEGRIGTLQRDQDGWAEAFSEDVKTLSDEMKKAIDLRGHQLLEKQMRAIADAFEYLRDDIDLLKRQQSDIEHQLKSIEGATVDGFSRLQEMAREESPPSAGSSKYDALGDDWKAVGAMDLHERCWECGREYSMALVRKTSDSGRGHNLDLFLRPQVGLSSSEDVQRAFLQGTTLIVERRGKVTSRLAHTPAFLLDALRRHPNLFTVNEVGPIRRSNTRPDGETCISCGAGWINATRILMVADRSVSKKEGED